MNKINMLDLRKQFAEIRDDVLASVKEVLESGQYVLGPKVSEFEKQASEFLGGGHGVGVASGTDALHLVIKALGIKGGDEVITTPFTFFATIEAIIYVGATPVFVDIEPDTFNIDPEAIEERITPKTRAIIPVHLFGHPAGMKRIMEVAGKHEIAVIEDCAQSFGASIGGVMTGAIGDAGCFSFYPSKNLGACGDGGLLLLRDGAVAEKVLSLRNHGSSGAYLHGTVGINSRLDEVQAAILLVKLKHIERHNEARRMKAARYTELLGDSVICPVEKESCKHVYHQYTIRSPERDRIRKRLSDEGVSSMIYYPVPAHLQPALGGMGFKEGSLPASETASKEVLSLPMGPELDDHDIERIADIIKSA